MTITLREANALFCENPFNADFHLTLNWFLYLFYCVSTHKTKI